jgi:hypothetical protein
VSAGFAIRLDTGEPVHHLVGLAVRAERLGATAVLVGDGGTGRDVLVAVAAMAVATDRVALLPLLDATSPTAVRRAAPALASLAELSDGRVVGCVPAAALRSVPATDPSLAVVARGPRTPIPAGVVGVVAEGDPAPRAAGRWTVWSPPAVPDRLDGEHPDVVAYRLARHDVEELADLAAHARAAGLDATVDLVGVSG